LPVAGYLPLLTSLHCHIIEYEAQPYYLAELLLHRSFQSTVTHTMLLQFCLSVEGTTHLTFLIIFGYSLSLQAFNDD